MITDRVIKVLLPKLYVHLTDVVVVPSEDGSAAFPAQVLVWNCVGNLEADSLYRRFASVWGFGRCAESGRTLADVSP